MTRKRKSVITGLIALAIVGAVVLMLPREIEEPLYEGKRYDEWIKEALALGSGPSIEKGRKEAIEAIKAIGTNAIPYLLQEITAKDSSVKQFVIKRMPRQVWRSIGIKPAPWRRDVAQVGFRILRDHKNVFIQSLQDFERDPELAPTIRPLLESLDRGW